ncbi:hypothetical protein HDU89_005886 [Geranomyces variabilis]|nr:hypothetical protein HDU89_005886 [Geranomyces variabilis]
MPSGNPTSSSSSSEQRDPVLPSAFEVSRNQKATYNGNSNTESSTGKQTRGGSAADDSESWLPDLPLLVTHAAIILVCGITLILGKHGTVHVSNNWPLLKPGVVAFCVGIIVQLALIAPLEFAKRISQIWFWQELTKTGMDYRTMVTTWSVIYSNSYRGAEDLLHGIGPISAFLMFVYVIEVAICGAIGSLYETRDITTLKATGTMPLFYPTQDPAITFNQAKAPIDLASRAFLNFARAYDPLALGGILSGDGTCNNGMVSAGHAASCNSVILSPLAPISLLLGPQPPALPWTTLAPGDTVVTRSTRLDTMIECGPSDAIKLMVVNGSDYLWLNVTVNGTPTETHSYLRLWSAQSSSVETPQVQTVMFGAGVDYGDPVVDDSGALVFAILAFNLDTYHDMTVITVPYNDVPGTRTAGVALCTARLAVGTVTASYEVSQVEPASVLKLQNVVTVVPPQPYSMSADTAYGFASALFIFQSIYSVTCDILPCVPTGYDPPLVDLIIGLLREIPNPGGPPKFAVDLATIATAISQLTSRMMVSFAAPPAFPKNLPPQCVATTSAQVFHSAAVQQFYTTTACNAVLAVGAASAAGVMVILALSGRRRRMGRSTESLYLLLQALPSNTLPNIPDSEWRSARLGRLKAAARNVHYLSKKHSWRQRQKAAPRSDLGDKHKDDPPVG